MDEQLDELNNQPIAQAETAEDGAIAVNESGADASVQATEISDAVEQNFAKQEGEKNDEAPARYENGKKRKKKKIGKRAKKLIINISVIVVLTAVTFTILLTSYKELNFQNIGDFLKSSNGWYIAAAVGCMIASILFEALDIFIVSTTLGSKPKPHSAIAYASSDVYYSAITPSATGGQPAAMFYMVRDGIPAGTAGFTMVFNITLYAAAILILGIFSLIVHPEYYAQLGNNWARVLWIFGIVIQILLVLFNIVCMLWSKAILKCGNWIISLLAKMKIVKKPDKWRAKLQAEVEKYAANRQIIKKHPFMCFWTLVFNLCQRISHTLITCFIVYAADPDTASFLDIFVMQIFVLVGYNSIPLPGGVGAYEVMYMSTYGICFGFDNSGFILSAMMVSRVISYYIRMAVCGLYTLCYHAVGIKKNPRYGDDEDVSPEQVDTVENSAQAETRISDANVAEKTAAVGECESDGQQINITEDTTDDLQ